MSGFLGVPVDAAYHIVFALTGALTPVLGGLAAATAIVMVTITVRLVIAPLSFRALRGQAAQARLAPELAALRQRYARQPERLHREMTALYRREGTSMLAAITPLLAQWPFLSVLYLLFRSSRIAGGPNQLLTRALFGVPLGAHWLSGPGAASVQGGVFIGVLAALAALCWLSARIARRMTAAVPPPAALPGKPGQRRPRAVVAGDRAAADTPVAGAGAVRFLGAVAPYLTVVIAAFAPLAAGLYLITTMAAANTERWLFLRRASGDNVRQRQRGRGAPGGDQDARRVNTVRG